METCYNCGKKILKGIDQTKEHIPAKGLFGGFTEEYKKNIITVPACLECNNKYSLVDEEFRNLIGGISKHEQNNEITSKTARSLIRNWPKNIEKINLIEPGLMTLTLDSNKICNFHKKNFKGVFYKQYGHRLPDNYKLMVNIDEGDYSDGLINVLGYLTENFDWKVSGHEDVFKYILQPIKVDWTNTLDKPDLKPQEDEPIYAALMIYNKSHAALVVASKDVK